MDYVYIGLWILGGVIWDGLGWIYRVFLGLVSFLRSYVRILCWVWMGIWILEGNGEIREWNLLLIG